MLWNAFVRYGTLICFLSVVSNCKRNDTPETAITPEPPGSVEHPADAQAAPPSADDDEDPDIPSTRPPNDTPQLLLADRAHLARVRESLARGEPQYRRALDALVAAANDALTIERLSVVDKEVTPPSGDKHDYMSQAPYYWPDPSKPDGKPYVRRDGERNPEIDKLTDRANLERLSRAVAALSVGFYLTGRQQYAEHAAKLVRGWFMDPATRMNPSLRFGQGIPGRVEGRSAGIVETRFLPNILAGLTLLTGSSAWTAADDQALMEWMRAYLNWLVVSPLGRDEAQRNNNHETWADVQISALALYTGKVELARTTLEGARGDIAEAFEPDGSQPRELARTRPWRYSLFNLTAFMALAGIGERVGIDLWNYTPPDGAGLRKGLDYLVPFATGEEPFPNLRLDEVRPRELHLLLRRAAVAWNEPRYREIAEQIGGGTELMDLLLP
jgi:hypothetical protein